MLFTGNRLLTLLLFAAFNTVMALPLTEEADLINSSNNLDIIEYNGAELLSDKVISQPQMTSKTQSAGSVIVMEQDINANDMDLLKSSDYFEVNKAHKRRTQYGGIHNTQKAGSKVLTSRNTSPVSGNVRSLLNEEAIITPELKDKIKGSLESVKQIKDALMTDSEINYEDAAQDTEMLIQKEAYLRKQHRFDEVHGINNKVTKEKYTASMFREFIDKVINFVMYAVILGIFVKLLMMFIAWQRKLNQY